MDDTLNGRWHLPDEWPDPDADWVWREIDGEPHPPVFFFDQPRGYVAGSITDSPLPVYRIGRVAYDTPRIGKPGDGFEVVLTEEGATFTLHRRRRWYRPWWRTIVVHLTPKRRDA